MNVSGGSLNITSQNFDIHGGGTGLRNIVHQPLPASGPWTATIKANWDPTTNYNNAGLMVYGDDANFIKAGMVWSGGRKFEAFKELNNTATALGSATANMPATFPTTWYLRLTSNGTTIQPAYTADGITWTNYGATTNLTGITAPKVGVYATSASAVNRELKVDWFKLTTPETPTDEFDGGALNLCRWNSIVRHEPGGYTVGGGKLTLPAAHGDFFGGSAPNNNPNMLLQPAPSGPWTMETRLAFNPNENYEQAGLLVYSDDQNYVKADYVFAGNRALEFLNEVNGTTGGFDNTINISTRPTTVDMRIVSDGTTLRAWYRFEGDANWSRFGSDTPLASAGPAPKIGIYANDSNATVTTRDDAVFEYFRITSGAPDSAAPTSAATTAGTGPVTVTVTGADEAGGSGLDKLEYRLDGGAWTTYTQPVVVSAVGPHTLEHRATDKAGNVGTVGSVAFTIAAEPAPGTPVVIGGDVPGVLALTIGSPPSFGTFTPGVTRDYTASTTVGVTSTAADAKLTVSDPATGTTGKLVNGTFALAQPLQVKATSTRGTPSAAFASLAAPVSLLNYSGPVGKDTATIDFKQSIAETDDLRRGAYAKTLTFTLSTTTP